MKKLRLKKSTRFFQGHQVGKRWSHSLTLGWLSLGLLLTCAISPSPLHGSQPCCGKGACSNQWNYEPCHSGPLKMDKSWWRVLTKRGLPEEGMANYSNIFAARPSWVAWKSKKIWCWMMGPLSWKVSNMILGKSVGHFLIAPERMKWLGQSRNDAQLWMCLVVKVQCCKEQYCIGIWNIRSMNQSKLDIVKQKIEHWYLMNQWTKMDRNGWI